MRGNREVTLPITCITFNVHSYIRTGMVSMCAGCNLYEPWAAIIVGIGAGFSFLLVHFAMLKFR